MVHLKILLILILFLTLILVVNAVYPKTQEFLVERRKSLLRDNTEKLLPKANLTKPEILVNRLPKNLAVDLYEITIQPYFPADNVTYDSSKNFTFDGYTKIHFHMLQDSMNISVDALNLNFLSLSLYANNVRQQLISSQYDSSTYRFTIKPVMFLKPNITYRLEFNYTGLINDYRDGGLFYTRWRDNYFGYTNHYIVATFFAIGYGARSTFPCFDDPSFKANFSVTLISPTAFKALGNMPLESESEIDNGYSIRTFKTTLKMSTYLIAFAIGDLVNETATAKDGTQISFWAWNADLGTDEVGLSGPWMDRLNVSLDTSVKCFEVLSDYMAFKFPLPKLDHLALPQFSYGGMENWGLITYDYNFVLFKDGEDHAADKLLSIQIMCHEMAHQWFGDLVTNEWWSEIMLHESLADYFEMTSIGIMYPNQSEFMDSYFVATRQEHALQVDSGYYNNTLTGGKIHPLILKPDGSFDDITYEKGGALLRMLSGTFGPTLFQEALRNYLVKYQFGNADHFQFFEEFTQVAQKYKNITDFCGNPLDVNQLMDAWVNVPHFPQIDVDLTNDGRAFVPSQEPFLPIWYLPQGYNYSWMIPTYVLDYQKGRSFKWIPPNNFSCPHFDKHIDIQTFDPYMLYNDGAPTYARVHYEEGAHNKIRQLLRQDNGTISINTKIRLIADEWAFIDRDMVLLGLPPKLHRGMQILESILNSSFSVHTTTFMAAQSVFDTIFELSRDRHEYELYLKFLIPILENFYQKVGWNGTNDDFNTNMLRERVLYYAVRFDILDSRAMAMQYWKNLSVWCAMHFDYNCNILNPNIRRAVYCGAMWDDNGSVFGQLREFLEIAEGGYYTSREITSIVSGLACAQNHTIINWILDDLYSLSNNSTRYNLYNSFSYFYNNLNASEVMADYIIKNPQKVLDGLSCYIGLPCVMEPFLDGMTGLWYTDRRKDQYNQIYNQLYPNMDIYDKAYFQTYYNVLLSANLRGQYVYPDMTRWMYDNYVPIGKSPWTVKINQTIVPYNYNLTVKPYFPSSYKYGIGKNFTFDAIVNISATILQQDTIILNSHRHMIHRIQVTANRSIINIPIAAVYRDNENAFLTIKLAQPILQKTSINIIIEYTGFIKDSPGEGEYINFDYLEVNKKKSWIFATDFEGGPSARSLVPCLDEPAYKATWSVTVQYPMDMVALSNGLEERTISLGGGLAQTTFKDTPKMSSYLLAITIGDYAALRGLTNSGQIVRIWTWTGMQNNAVVALKAAIDTINFLTNYTGITLPLDKVDVMCLPQYEGDAMYAMENWGLIIAGYKECLWSPDYRTTYHYTDTYWTIAHETTHQWFGDLVTLEWWNYIFLNEAFATYWPLVVMNATYPDQADYANFQRFYDAETGFVLDQDIDTTVPIVVNETRLGHGYDLFGNLNYYKASSILHMLHTTINNTNFQKSLQNYLLAHEQGNAKDFQLWQKFDEVMLNSTSIHDWNSMSLNVTKYMTPWFYQETFPIIKVVTTSDGLSYNFQQTPFIQSGLPNDQSFLWPIQLWFETEFYERRDFTWLASQSTLPKAFPRGWRVVNPKREAYARVWYDDLSWAPIQTQLQSNWSVFDPITRAQFIIDTYTLANQQFIPWSRFLNLVKYAGNAPELDTWQILSDIMDEFGTTSWLAMFKFQPEYAKLQTLLLQLLSTNKDKLFIQTGNWAKDMSSHYITGLSCYLGSNDCLNQASSLFNQFISNCQNSAYGTGKCNKVPPDHRVVQYCFGLRQNPSSVTAVWNLIQWFTDNSPLTDYFNDVEALLVALACLNDDNQVEQYLMDAVNYRLSAEFFSFSAQYDMSGNRLFNFLQKNLQIVINSEHFNEIVNNLAFGWSTDEQLNKLQNVDWQGITLTSNQANAWNKMIAGVNETRNWLKKNQPAISTWFNMNG